MDSSNSEENRHQQTKRPHSNEPTMSEDRKVTK